MRRKAISAFLIILTVLAAGAAAHAHGEHKTAEQLAAEAEELMEMWGIDQEELERFNKLMRGPRGSFSNPRISPVEVLGIHAETKEKRYEYAERFVRIQNEDTERIFAFERAVAAAWQRLDKPKFDPALMPKWSKYVTSKSVAGRALVLFVATDSCRPCQSETRRLLEKVDTGVIPKLDIFITDTTSPEEIMAWARDLRVDRSKVKNKIVTLNIGQAAWGRFDPKPILPALFFRSEISGNLEPFPLPDDPEEY